MAFAQGEVKPCVHARAAEHVVEQVERYAQRVVYVECPRPHHDVRLVGVLVENNRSPRDLRGDGFFGQRFCFPFGSSDSGQIFLQQLHQTAETDVAVGKENHVLRAVVLLGEP